MMLSARASLSTPLPSSRLAFFRRRRGVFVGDRGVDAPSVRTDSGEPGSGELGLAAPSWSEARISADNAALATVGRDGGKCAMRASSFTAHASHTRTGSLCPSLGNGLRFVEHWAQKMPPHLPHNPNNGQATCVGIDGRGHGEQSAVRTSGSGACGRRTRPARWGVSTGHIRASRRPAPTQPRSEQACPCPPTPRGAPGRTGWHAGSVRVAHRAHTWGPPVHVAVRMCA